jgi:hypothetical protein
MALNLPELAYVKPCSQKRKPGPTAKYRAKRRRAEGPVLAAVRATCDERDGYCRLMGLSPCSGESQLAHLEEKKRTRTRGMLPEERHVTTHAAKFCEGHHGKYDAGKIQIALGERGADGPMRAQEGTKVLIV